MANRESMVREYFGAPADCFWQWQDDGEAVTWRDGKLIAFSQELTHVLQHMAPSGLPRLGALLLLIAATRKDWAVDGSEAGLLTSLISATPADEDEQRIQKLRRKPSSAQQSKESPPSGRLALLQRVLAGLHKVRALDSSLRVPLEAKAALASIVFDDTEPAVPKLHAAHIADAIRPGLLSVIASTTDSVSSGIGPNLLLRDLADIAAGIERITPEAVRVRLETGLDALPASAPIEEEADELSPSESARVLIQELLDSPEHKGMAKLAKQLLASTTLPRKLSESQEHEMGGYSDIANRGTPDRLLLSELAQDGLTLAVRVAMNEAMYLHRETPPSVPRVRRELLIDSGVHAWGLPRVFAASVALAFAANTPENASFAAWRGCGAALKGVDLSSREGLIDHLAALESDPHLGEALPRFSSLIGDTEDPVEVIVLMPADVSADPEVSKALRGLSAERVYIATVDREGGFRLSERGPRGEKLLRNAKLSLEQLFTDETRLTNSRELDRMPAIFRADPFPLCLPAPLDAKTCWSLGNPGALSISGDGRLLKWTDSRRGAEQITDRLPKGQLWWVSPDCAQGRSSFVYGPSQSPTLYHLDLAHGDLQAIHLRCAVTTGVVCHNGAYFCLQASKLTEFNPQTGEAGQELAIPPILRRIGGRYFQDRVTNAWHALSHDGHAATIDPLPSFDTINDPIVYVWDPVGFSELLALTSGGRLLAAPDDRDKLPSKTPQINDCSVVEASHDGKHLVISGVYRGVTQHYVLSLNLRPTFHMRYGTGIERRVSVFAQPATIRKHFQSIGVTEEGALALRATKNIVVLQPQAGMPVLGQHPRSTPLFFEQGFHEVKTHSGVRLKLSTAEWPSGDRAVLDSRGLLHLQPASTSTPETSLVLAEGEMTGWNSTGQYFGKQYFAPAGKESSGRAPSLRKIHQETIAPFLESLRANS